MGKASKKIKKNIISTKGQLDKQEKQQEIIKIQEQALMLKEAGKYEDALKVIIDALENGQRSPDLFYQTADTYYLIGDYERATTWAQNTIKFDNNNIKAQILLAKLYAMQDDLKNSFAMLENLIRVHNEISADVCDEIEDLLFYFQDDYDETTLQKDYPLLFDFWQSTKEFGHEEVNLENVEETEQIEASKINELSVSPENLVKQDDESNQSEEKTIDGIIKSIMEQDISLIEKLDLCLDFAVRYYSQKDNVKTLLMLKQALLIDGKNDLVLKNIGTVLSDMGEKAGALEILSKIKEKDLMVIRQIEELSK